jgi:hypothetical protein
MLKINDKHIYLNGKYFDRMSDSVDRIIEYLLFTKIIPNTFKLNITLRIASAEDLDLSFEF